MDGLNLGWSRDETVFAITAISILAVGVLRIDQLLFRPKKRPQAPQKPRKHRVSYVVEVEEVDDQDAKGSSAKR